MARPLSVCVAGFAVLASLAMGCASVPRPEAQVSAADLALRKAEQADAAHYAPLEMRRARDQLEQSRLAVQDDRYLEARRLAEDAEVGAQLAESKARAGRAGEAEKVIRDNIESLRSEARRAADRVK